MPNTTNFNWATPADTDLVKDGAAAIRTLGSSIDTSFVDLNGGTTGQVLAKASGTDLDFTWSAASSVLTRAVFTDEKAQGTHGGTFTTGAWRTRDINTTQYNNITSASIASNQITLPAGTYELNATCPAVDINQFASRLYNITDSSVTILGSSTYSDQADSSNQTPSFITGIFTIAGTKVFEIQNQGGFTKTTVGFGLATNYQAETYTIVSITKI
jgi:hypothetical protein